MKPPAGFSFASATGAVRVGRCRRVARATAFAALALSAVACVTPSERSAEVPPELRREIMIGRALAARLAQRYGVYRDRTATIYVGLVGQTVSRGVARPELNFHFGVLETEEVNAFSCPGGYILVTMGALRLMEDESELAGVLAHEVSHVALMHAGPFEERGGWVDFIADFLGAGGGNIVNTALRQTVEALEARLLETGRAARMEFEADQTGLLVAQAAGYEPGAALRYLRRLRAGQNFVVLNRTHPSVSDRLEGMRSFLFAQNVTDRGERNQKRFARFKASLPKPKEHPGRNL